MPDCRRRARRGGQSHSAIARSSSEVGFGVAVGELGNIEDEEKGEDEELNLSRVVIWWVECKV